MHSKPANAYPRTVIDQLLATIPFYKQVKQQDSWQFELLLQHSTVVSFEPGEIVVQQGDEGTWLYFLLKGQLVVLSGDTSQARSSIQAVNYITPGELFGDLAMLRKQERTATVRADHNSREVLVFATDYSVFGELGDTHRVSLATKLNYYRNLNHSLRWKLEVYRNKFAQHPLAQEHRLIKLFRGSKDTKAELEALHQQACQMADLLVSWNQASGCLSAIENPSLGKSL